MKESSSKVCFMAVECSIQKSKSKEERSRLRKNILKYSKEIGYGTKVNMRMIRRVEQVKFIFERDGGVETSKTASLMDRVFTIVT